MGDIGLVVKNISIGLLGYFAYPIFLYCIIRGIFLLQNKELSVRLRNLISIIAIFLCAGIIVHLATTSSYIGEFGSYMNRVFHSSTVGGVFMGLFCIRFERVPYRRRRIHFAWMRHCSIAVACSGIFRQRFAGQKICKKT